jgi:hypothetical protein
LSGTAGDFAVPIARGLRGSGECLGASLIPAVDEMRVHDNERDRLEIDPALLGRRSIAEQGAGAEAGLVVETDR